MRDHDNGHTFLIQTVKKLHDLSAGLGKIRLNGQSKGAFDAEYETGSNGGAEVELTAGVGDISVLTQQ